MSEELRRLREGLLGCGVGDRRGVRWENMRLGGRIGGNEFVIAGYVCMWKAEDRKSDRMQRAGVERRDTVGSSTRDQETGARHA